MPNPERLLLRLNISQPFGMAAPGGHDRLTRMDIAWALAGSGRRHLVWLAESMYLGDSSNSQRLMASTAQHFSWIGEKKGWSQGDPRYPQLMKGCAAIALFEVLTEEGRLCPRCKGLGEVKKRDDGDGKLHAIVCPRCHGIRPFEWSDGLRLAKLNDLLHGEKLARSTWYDTWRHRYYQCVIMIRQWRDELLRHVKRRAWQQDEIA